MKRILAILLLALMTCGTCVAEGLDYASMSDEQLHGVVDAARNELAKREIVAEGKTLLFEKEGVSVYLMDDFVADSIVTDSWKYMRADVVVVNDSERNVNVSIDSMSVNGWEVSSLGFSKITAGKKQKDELSFNALDTDVETVEEIETVEIHFRLSDADNFMFFADVDPVTIHFNVQ